ncbi:MAG: putative metal-binding motif-containing protein, partial [Planctomyces sp.]
AGSPLSCGGITSNSDCNDADVAINPAASEICDAGNVDENCNGVSDNDDALVLDGGRTDFFVDADNDLYTLSSTNRFCDLPALGYRAAASSLLDCNDAVAAINPGMTELCDASNVDENCNGVSDTADAGADA